MDHTTDPLDETVAVQGAMGTQNGASVPAVESKNSTESMKNDNAVRVLRRGDLVRIIGTTGKLRDTQGDLGKIVRSVPNDENNGTSTDPLKYDIDLVLGGKLHAVCRSDLQYTTASEEGMTGESRSKRKRKPSAVVEANNAIDGKPEKSRKKTKATQKQTKATNKKQKKTPAAKTATSKKRAPGNTKAKGTAKKAKAAPVEEPPPTTTSNVLDMYERHRREFERSIGRLEKTDVYHFFLADVPKEFDECYTSSDQADSLPTRDEPNSQELSLANGTSQESTGDKKKSATAPQHQPMETTSQSPIPENGVTKNCSVGTNTSNKSSIRFPDTPPYNFHIIRRRMEHGRYVLDRGTMESKRHRELIAPYCLSVGKKIPKHKKDGSKFPVLHPKGVNWELFQQDIIAMCDSAVERNPDMYGLSPGTLGHAAKKIKDLMAQIYEKTGRRHGIEMASANDSHRFTMALDSHKNTEAAMQTKWRREAFPERCYERLRTDAICAGLSELDKRIAAYELRTTLKDSFVGLSYTYDDTGQSEGWMKSLVQEAGDQSEREKAALAMASDDGVIKAQVTASMQSLLIAVQDKVMTELGVLEQRELKSANWIAESSHASKELLSASNPEASVPDIVEQPVWGIDCYTRRNIMSCLETVFDSDNILTFIEKWLLPAINACPEDLAYDIKNAARMLEGLPFDESSSLKNENGTTTEQWKSTLLGQALMNKISASGPSWLKTAAHLLRRACESLGPDFFRIHPKGHGSIVLCPKLEPNRLVTYYRGEVYPSWRWGEKMDAISMIQEKKGLKPGLPDFFNMALERPQKDPRGYGLLCVDASRKSGYGSMLSHSCQPSCEVRVAAVNGRLTLAMTTLREMTIGDELTFDYNAVTESLNEYQAAICLCGHGQCRGSFLHFATADCYQQVLNRNSPIAVRLSNLIKGSTKRVMSEEDDKILGRHGFHTAAFGAVSVNRRKASSLEGDDMSLDSMDMVPIWLRTFVADTLRYIEYERRALPIALICNELFTDTKEKDDGKPTNVEKSVKVESSPSSEDDEDYDKDDDEDETPVKGAKPEPTFFFYLRRRREHFVSILMAEDEPTTATGLALRQEILKLASTYWKSLDATAKEKWKQKAYVDWERNGGKEKAELEKQRLERLSKKGKSKNSKAKASASAKSKSKKEPSKSYDKNGDGKGKSATADKKESDKAEKISFQAADGEGISAMEQRIQQLTQTLSRVGRVLDRHREESITNHCSEDTIRDVLRPPLDIMPDEHVVAWVWNHEDGIVRTLLKYWELEVCVSPELRQAIKDTESKYKMLEDFGKPWCKDFPKTEYPFSPTEGRAKLNEALLKFREDILNGLQSAADEIKNRKASMRKESVRKKKEAEQRARQQAKIETERRTRSEVAKVLNGLISAVERKVSGMEVETGEQGDESIEKEGENESAKDGQSENDEAQSNDDEQTDDFEPWIHNYNKRFKLEKAADVLLFYARTSTFFVVSPYARLISTPIEVYARELGNSVPASVIDTESVIGHVDKTPPLSEREQKVTGEVEEDSCGEDPPVESENTGKQAKRQKSKLCLPEDIVANVSVEYQGDYVVSQLLQWYNAGIDQKPGLPDLLGCVMLPSMEGCFTIDNTQGSSSRTDRPTGYHMRTRRRIVEWLSNSQQRGSPWPDDIRRAFVEKAVDLPVSDACAKWTPLGSPILDFLVTGDDYNINSILLTLGIADRSTEQTNGLLSSVDHGRPAQAVSNWVQCENPDCQKWRKVPWNVDIDMISEKFVCKDNVWNPKFASCDAPEDDWDETTDAQVDADGSAVFTEPNVKPDLEKLEDPSVTSFQLTDFRLGAKFDVLRDDKTTWSVGVVVKLDLTGEPRRVKFHFAKTGIADDEWIEVESPRIAHFRSKSTASRQKATKDKAASSTATAAKRTSGQSVHSEKAADVTSAPEKDGDSAAPPTSGLSKHPSETKRSANGTKKPKSKPRLTKFTRLKSRPLSDQDSEASTDDCFSTGSGDDSHQSEAEKTGGNDEIDANDVSNTVTDDSSPDDSLRTQTSVKMKPKSNVWTIPKKKRSPVKASLGLLGGDGSPPKKSPPVNLLDSNKAAPMKVERSLEPRRQQQSEFSTDPKQTRQKPESEFQIARKSDPNQIRQTPDSEFHISRKAPKALTAPEQMRAGDYCEPQDGREIGEIASPVSFRGSRGDDYDRHEALPESSYSRHHNEGVWDDHGRSNHGYHSRLRDSWDDERSPRRGHAPSQGASWEEDRRDRRRFATDYDDDWNDDRRYGRRDDDRPSGYRYESHRSSYDHDYGNDRYNDYAYSSRDYSGRQYDDDYYDDRRRYRDGDYEIPHESRRNSYHRRDGYHDERSGYYESRNIFQDHDSRYEDSRRRGNDKGYRDEDYKYRRENRVSRRDSSRGDISRRFEPAPGASPDSAHSKSSRYHSRDDISRRFEPAPGASPDSSRYNHTKHH